MITSDVSCHLAAFEGDLNKQSYSIVYAIFSHVGYNKKVRGRRTGSGRNLEESEVATTDAETRIGGPQIPSKAPQIKVKRPSLKERSIARRIPQGRQYIVQGLQGDQGNPVKLSFSSSFLVHRQDSSFRHCCASVARENTNCFAI